jgi:hypothetical protein
VGTRHGRRKRGKFKVADGEKEKEERKKITKEKL